MATKRIYQIAKELECDEKKIIEFLTAQGIKVANRLSAVSEEGYNLVKTKLLAPPPPPPPPPPEPVVEKPAQVAPPPATPTAEVTEQPAGGKKKKKKKNKPVPTEEQKPQAEDFVPVSVEEIEASTRIINGAGIEAGNDFISNRYIPLFKSKGKEFRTHLTRNMDPWGLLQDMPFDSPETSPFRYWQAVNKLTTSAYRLIQEYGLQNRELLAEMRETMKVLGVKFEPQEIFTEKENKRFAEQQEFLFQIFGHGMGTINEELFKLKMYAERKRVNFEHMDFLDYLTNLESPDAKIPVPFAAIADAITYSISSIPLRVNFYKKNKELVIKCIENFFAWIEGYKKLKEQGADAAKLEKYLYLEEKLIKLIEFMSLDNLLIIRSKRYSTPFEITLDYLNKYRDNMDDPDAERNFKFKVRGVINLTYKSKEYVFLFQFADLEPYKDYRPADMKEETPEETPAEVPDELQEESPAEEPDEA